ncbi:hypothetical protein F5884DRAFT_520236 [Xylogone sp. PMI_703]|nr:hypothetical protein F5884DRAFT_520236 [Xylogone sp. PMI_703]
MVERQGKLVLEGQQTSKSPVLQEMLEASPNPRSPLGPGGCFFRPYLHGRGAARRASLTSRYDPVRFLFLGAGGTIMAIAYPLPSSPTGAKYSTIQYRTLAAASRSIMHWIRLSDGWWNGIFAASRLPRRVHLDQGLMMAWGERGCVGRRKARTTGEQKGSVSIPFCR